MAVRIRLTRYGRKYDPLYRIGVFDSRTRRDGRYLENLGTYRPKQRDPEKKIDLNKDRYDHWVSKGALPSEELARILTHTKVLEAK